MRAYTVASCFAFIVTTALAAVADDTASNVANSDGPPGVRAPAASLGILVRSTNTMGPFAGTSLTFATARIESGNLVIGVHLLEHVQSADGRKIVTRPVYKEYTVAVNRASFIRPKGDKLEFTQVEKVLAKMTPVLLARYPAALEDAYLELINPNAIVIVFRLDGRAPNWDGESSGSSTEDGMKASAVEHQLRIRDYLRHQGVQPRDPTPQPVPLPSFR